MLRIYPNKAQEFYWGWGAYTGKWTLSTNDDYSIVGDSVEEGKDGDHLNPENYMVSQKCVNSVGDPAKSKILCISGFKPEYFESV